MENKEQDSQSISTPLAANGPSRIESLPKYFRIPARLSFGIISFWLFLVALATMKSGANLLAPTLQGSVFTDNLLSTLGFGWISSMIVMSGSPIAVSALTLFAGDAISQFQAFLMLTGSRIGVSWVVLTVAFIYALRRRKDGPQSRATLSIGIYTLILTALAYIPAAFIGLELLRRNTFERFIFAAPGNVLDVFEVATGPVIDVIRAYLPTLLIFPLGIGFLLISMRGFDSALPDLNESSVAEHKDWRSKPWLMFLLGSFVALVTMSVSIALTILIPAVAKGIFKREHAIPYILGANIATLGDTLLVSALLGFPAAVEVVLVEVFSVTLVTLILLLLYRPLTYSLVFITDKLLDNRLWLAAVLAAMLLIPIVLIIL